MLQRAWVNRVVQLRTLKGYIACVNGAEPGYTQKYKSVALRMTRINVLTKKNCSVHKHLNRQQASNGGLSVHDHKAATSKHIFLIYSQVISYLCPHPTLLVMKRSYLAYHRFFTSGRPVQNPSYQKANHKLHFIGSLAMTRKHPTSHFEQ